MIAASMLALLFSVRIQDLLSQATKNITAFSVTRHTNVAQTL